MSLEAKKSCGLQRGSFADSHQRPIAVRTGMWRKMGTAQCFHTKWGDVYLLVCKPSRDTVVTFNLSVPEPGQSVHGFFQGRWALVGEDAARLVSHTDRVISCSSI